MNGNLEQGRVLEIALNYYVRVTYAGGPVDTREARWSERRQLTILLVDNN